MEEPNKRVAISELKVALVHDWLVTYAGAERVLEQLLILFPLADVFTMVDFLPESDRHMLAGRKITTSFIQRLPFARKRYRHYLPLMPLAVEQFDLSSYQIVISSSHAVAKGVITGPGQRHISYVHSPMRYAWDLQHQYLRESELQTGIKGFIVKYLLHRLRLWDLRTANGVDIFVANSKFIAQRIWKVYRRESIVIYPPVYVQDFTLNSVKQNFYVTASRMVPYKKIDIIVEAFKLMPNKRLVVIGDGPDFDKISTFVSGYANIDLLGFQKFEVLKDYLQQAKGFVFAAEEDFGITPLEAQACGTPVIAFGRGGALETVKDGVTGLFFSEQTPQAIVDAVTLFEQSEWSAQDCRMQAEQFTCERFHQEILSLVARVSASD